MPVLEHGLFEKGLKYLKRIIPYLDKTVGEEKL